MEIQSRLPKEEVVSVLESGNFTFSKVAITVIRDHRNRILMLQKSATDRVCPDEWGFPGGNIKDGETPEQAAIRETNEETCLYLTIDSLRRRDYSLVLTKEGYVLYDWYIYDVKEVIPSDIIEVHLSSEHQDSAWVSISTIDGTDYGYEKYTVADNLVAPLVS